jgi:hypothetical protein
MLAGRESAADCNRICPAGVERDERGCCPSSLAPTPTSGPARAPVAAACPEGQQRNDDTAGHCCWSGQVWAGGKCNGAPAACPRGFSVVKETCKPSECGEGMTHPANARTECCWPGQLWSKVNSTCVGTPRCPKGFELRGDTCGDLAEEARVAAEWARRAAEQKERLQREEAERIERERREQAERLDRLRREEAARIEEERREEERRRAAQIAAEAQKREDERAARFAEAKQKAEDNRDSAKVALGFGIGIGVLSAPFIGLSFWENGRIQGGGFSTGSDIQSAAGQGKAFNIAAAAFGAAGGALFVGGVIGIAVNHEPKESDVARAAPPPRAEITVGPSGLGLRGAF